MENKTERHHGPGQQEFEKPKDLSQAINKLFSNLKPYLFLIIISFVLEVTESVFSIIGPNKLSDLTNKISEGLIINRDKFSEFNTSITNDLNQDNIANLTQNIIDIKIDKDTISSIMDSNDISSDDKVLFNNFLSSTTDKSTMMSTLTKLPSSITNIILPTSTYKGVEVTSLDKINYLTSLSSMSSDMSSTDMINIINSLPYSIKELLLPTSTFDNIEITYLDKISYLEALNGVTSSSNNTDIYAAIDNMPENIKDIIKPTMDIDGIKAIVIFLIIIYVISAIFNFLQSFIMADVANNFSKDLRNRLSHKINKLPLKYFDKHSTGDILSRVTNDVDTIGQAMYQSLGSLIGEITLLVGTIIMMFITNYIMAIAAILSSILGFVFMFIIMGKSQKYFSMRQTELGKLNGHIEEIYSSHNIVKAYNGEDEARNKFDKLNSNVYEANLKSQFLSGLMQPIMGFIGNFSYVIVCIIGAILVMNDMTTFGTIVAFTIYIRLFTNPLSQIAQGVTNLQTATAASERVFEFLDEEELPKEIQNVRVDKHDTIIKDFTCNVNPGQKIAIVGPTGAGKTTLVNLLMKFYDIDSGDIKIDGINTKDLTRENIHDLFTMVLQDTWLFEGTIKENIVYNQENVSDEMVEEVCK